MNTLSQLIDEEFHDCIEINRANVEKKNRSYCSNCGKNGHNSKKCNEPIISIGIINLYLNDDTLTNSFMNKYVMKNVLQNYTREGYQIKNISLTKFNEKNNGHLTNASEIEPYVNIAKKNVKFLMIRRKYSVGYIEFVKGRYSETNEEEIIYLVNQMTPDELTYLQTHTFDEIWHDMWDGKYDNLPLDENLLNEVHIHNMSYRDVQIYTKVHLKEYNTSKMKFELLKADNVIQRLIMENKLDIKYNEPEWGFPKGRRNLYEKNIDCAVREFTEETGIRTDKINVMDRIFLLNETLTGTNNVDYKHWYYLSISKMEPVALNSPSQRMEIGDIAWLSYDEAKEIIRPYHTNRLTILDEIVMFLAYNLKYYSNTSI
jgi:8-oxo-dGTP pyrophosphatase MutT (NUDIX family)